MPISNPIKFFISGNEEKHFTYEGGANLWHFSPNQCGLSRTMEMNIIFFANDAKHALDIVERIMNFAINCYDTKYPNAHPEIAERRQSSLKRYLYLLENKEKWIVTLAPVNQIYKVGWAGNDTI